MFNIRWWHILVFILLSFIMLWVSVRIVYTVDYPNSDFFSFWLAGRMVWTDQNPYSPDQWIESHHQFGADWIPNPTFPYPLPLAFFFASLGIMRLDHAYIVWVFLSELFVLVTIFLVFFQRQIPKIRYYVFPILAAVYLFRPVMVTFRNGQIGAFLLIVLTLVMYLWEKGKWIQGAVLLPIIALKPQLGIPILLILCIWLWTHRNYAALSAVVVAGMTLLSIGWLISPNWILDFLNIGKAKVAVSFVFTPTLWGLASTACSHQINCSLLLGGLFALVMIAMTLFLLLIWTRRDHLVPSSVISIAIPVTLLTTPYLWAYDQILLVLPILVVVVTLAEKGYPFLLTSTLFLWMTILSLLLLVVSLSLQVDVWSALIPLIVLCLVLWQVGQKNRIIRVVSLESNLQQL